MGKLMSYLEKQLRTEHKKDAEDCIKLYNWLKDIDDGKVWNSKWSALVDVKFKGFPSDEKIYKPNKIGYAVLKGIEQSITNK